MKNLALYTLCALFVSSSIFYDGHATTTGTLQFSIAARFGVQEAKTKDEEPYQFSSIMNLDCDNDGTIYVLDYKEVCVKVFDINGRFLRKMFRFGQGPQELSAPYRLRVNKFSGNLFVVQEHGFQIKEFDVYGNYVKTHMPPEQILYDFNFYDEDRAVFIVKILKERNFCNLVLYNLKTSKIEKEFASFDIPGMSRGYQKFVIKDDLLWTCPGDRMELVGFDMKTGKETANIPIPEKGRESEMLRGENWQAVRIYNFGQPLLIDDKLYVYLTKQQFPPPRADWPTHPTSREIILYALEKGRLRKILDFPKYGFFIDFHTTWQNRLIISSSGYDLFPQVLVLKLL